MKIQKVNKLLAIETKENFLRRFLIELAKEENVNPKLLESKFEIEEFEKEFFVFIGDGEIDYTCSIGYNRTQEYIAMEKEIKLINYEYVEEINPVNKTKIVTDWQPYSGSFSSECTGVIDADGKIVTYYDFTTKSIECDEVVELGSDMIEKGKRSLHDSLSYSAEKKLPGDEYRDFRGNSEIDILGVYRYLVPYYKIKYSFEGEEKIFEHKATENEISIYLNEEELEFSYEVGKFKAGEFESGKFDAVNIEKLALEDEKVKMLKKVSIVSMVAFFGSMLIWQFLPFILGLLIFVATIAATFISYNMMKKLKGNLESDLKAKEKARKEEFDAKEKARREEFDAKEKTRKEEFDAKEKARKEAFITELQNRIYENLQRSLISLKLNPVTFDEVFGENK